MKGYRRSSRFCSSFADWVSVYHRSCPSHIGAVHCRSCGGNDEGVAFFPSVWFFWEAVKCVGSIRSWRRDPLCWQSKRDYRDTGTDDGSALGRAGLNMNITCSKVEGGGELNR